MIGRRGERGSGISVLAARHDDDDDDDDENCYTYVFSIFFLQYPRNSKSPKELNIKQLSSSSS